MRTRFARSLRPGRRTAVKGCWDEDVAIAQRLASVVEYSSDAIFSRTMDGIVTSWNAAAERMFGYSAKLIIGRSSEVLLPPDRQDELGQILGKIQRGEIIRCFESERLRQDGGLISVSLTVSPIKSARGKLVGTSTIARDITEERRAREALARSEQELAQLFQYAPFALVWLDSQGRIERLNNTAETWLECDSQDAAGQRLRDFTGDSSLFHKSTRRLAARQTIRNVQTLLHGKQGTIRTVMVYAHGVWDNERLVRTCWFLRDVTARRQLEQEVLAISERERQRFARELHDGLGQHLSGVAYLADSLVEQLAARQSPETAAAHRLRELIHESIQLTRGVAHGLLPVRPEPEGLMVALRDLAARTSGVFGVKCAFPCAKSVLIDHEATATQLYRIAQEAVHNAIRHGKADRISIRLRKNSRRLVLTVSDNGTGIGPLAPHRKGMGLHIMRYRAGLIDGSMVIQRRPRGGTEVSCCINLRNMQRIKDSQVAAAREQT